MSTTYLGIGSNVADAPYRIKKALELLSDSGCNIIDCSDIYQVSSPYYNLVAKAGTSMNYHSLWSLSKHLESLLGRLPHAKGDKVVPLDIDIVVFDGVTIRDSDFCATYFSIGYRQILEREH